MTITADPSSQAVGNPGADHDPSQTSAATAAPTPPAHQPRIDVTALLPRVNRALNMLDGAASDGPLDRSTRELVRTYVSMINGCAYCIDMHTKDARASGESEQRLYALPAWRETPYFTESEQAALALAEAMTRLPERGVPDEVFARAAAAFPEVELAQLVSVVMTINAWNLLGVTTHAWEPGTYQA